MLTAFYDLAASPPTYDFVGFLVSAERYRLALGADRMRVILVPGPAHGFRADSLPPQDPTARLRMRQKIVEPMCALLPSCEGVWNVQRANLDLDGPVFPIGYDGRPMRHYGMDHIVAAARAGCYPLRAPKPLSTLPPRTVTITLREASYWPTRNSCRPAWIEAAESLKARGWNPVFVPDTDGPDLPMGLPQYPNASVDLIFRANLYAAAALNLFVNNGPAWVASLMDGCPVVVLKMVSASPATSEIHFRDCDLPPGSQLGRPGHWIAWEDDTTEAILRAIEPRGAVI